MHLTLGQAVRRARRLRKQRSEARRRASQRGKTLRRGIKHTQPIRRAKMTGEPMPGTWPMVRNLLGKPGSIPNGNRGVRIRIKSNLPYAERRVDLSPY